MRNCSNCTAPPSELSLPDGVRQQQRDAVCSDVTFLPDRPAEVESADRGELHVGTQPLQILLILTLTEINLQKNHRNGDAALKCRPIQT
ncbi:hypothetical protein AOLI_G00027760 [Acnodon oligacanthus]